MKNMKAAKWTVYKSAANFAAGENKKLTLKCQSQGTAAIWRLNGKRRRKSRKCWTVGTSLPDHLTSATVDLALKAFFVRVCYVPFHRQWFTCFSRVDHYFSSIVPPSEKKHSTIMYTLLLRFSYLLLYFFWCDCYIWFIICSVKGKAEGANSCLTCDFVRRRRVKWVGVGGLHWGGSCVPLIWWMRFSPVVSSSYTWCDCIQPVILGVTLKKSGIKADENCHPHHPCCLVGVAHRGEATQFGRSATTQKRTLNLFKFRDNL